MIDEASQLQDQFVKVVTHAKIEFSAKTVEFLAKLQITLITLPLSDKFKHLHFLRKQRDRIMKASSIDEIFKILDDYWDYTDYALLQRLVEEFGESALKKEMSEYVAALEQFEKGTTIQESSTAASNSRHSKRKPPVYSDSSTVKLQLPRDYSSVE